MAPDRPARPIHCAALPSAKPDHGALERAIIDRWRRDRTFERLREQNAGGPRFGFIDGPVTANKVLGVHTAWGRTLKDVFQRYKALRGFHQRYQNGFDCQGLWIEVGVERQLGLNSKREIEEYGLEEFARECRSVVEWSARKLTGGSIRLGQWMDWGLDYYTFSDVNIEYIWRFLRLVHERGWLYRHRHREWCPPLRHVDLGARARRQLRRQGGPVPVGAPAAARPARRGAGHLDHHALDAARQRGRGRQPRRPLRAAAPTATGWRSSAGGDGPFDPVVRGAEMVGWRYEGPSTPWPPAPPSSIGWCAGTRSASRRAPASSTSPRLRRRRLRPRPGPRAARAGPGRRVGPLLRHVRLAAGQTTTDARDRIVDDLRDRGVLVDAGTITHRYPECWRCRTPLIFRISDDWFIASTRSASPCAANRTVEWTPAYMGKRMDDWLANMADWNISPPRYYGLPLPFYPCGCGHLTVVGSRAELAERATGPSTGCAGCAAVDRPTSRSPARRAAPRSSASPRWATCGSTPASCRSRPSAGRTRLGRRWLRHRRRRGPHPGRPARPRLLGGVVPRRLGVGDARADPPVVLLTALHVGGAHRAGSRTARCWATRRCSPRTAARCTARGAT